MSHETMKQKVSMSDLARSLFSALAMLIPLALVFLYGVVGTDKFLLISPVVMAGYFVLAVWMICSAFSKTEKASLPVGWVPLLIYLGWGIFLSFSCAIPYEAKVRLLMVGMAIGFYGMWSNSIASTEGRRGLLSMLLLFGLLISLYGLVNYFKNPETVLWGKRWVDQYIEHGADGLRLASTYICPNHFAHFLQMLVPFCLVLMFIPKMWIPVRILAGWCLLVFAPAMYLTQSRGGLIGAVAAVSMTVMALALRKSKKWFFVLLILGPLLLAAIGFGAWKQSTMLQRRMTPVIELAKELRTKGFDDANIELARPQFWLDTVEMIKEKPVTGFGPGNYGYLFPQYRKHFKSVRRVAIHPHNEYLEIPAEYGLVGLGIFALAWVWGMVRLLRFVVKAESAEQALLACAFLGTMAGTMTHAAVDFSMHEFPNTMTFVLLAGVAVGPLIQKGQALTGLRAKFAKGGQIAFALVAVGAFALAVQTFSSTFMGSLGQCLAESDQRDEAVRYYQIAIKIDPSNWRAYKGYGDILYRRRYRCLDPVEKKKLAEEEFAMDQQGYLHNAYDADLLLQLGNVLFFLGDHDTAIERLKEAGRIHLFNDKIWWLLAVAERKAGRYEDALEHFEYVNQMPGARLKRSARENIKWLKKQIKARKETQEKANLLMESLLKELAPAEETHVAD